MQQDLTPLSGSFMDWNIVADPNVPIIATYTITFPDGAGLDDLLPGTPLTGTGRKQIILVSDIVTKGLNYISIMPNYFRPL